MEQGGGYSKAARQPSGPQPTVTTALGALDLDHLMRIVGERVEHAHQIAPAMTLGRSLMRLSHRPDL